MLYWIFCFLVRLGLLPSLEELGEALDSPHETLGEDFSDFDVQERLGEEFSFFDDQETLLGQTEQSPPTIHYLNQAQGQPRRSAGQIKADNRFVQKLCALVSPIDTQSPQYDHTFHIKKMEESDQ